MCKVAFVNPQTPSNLNIPSCSNSQTLLIINQRQVQQTHSCKDKFNKMSELFGDMFAQDQELLLQQGSSSSSNGGTSKEGRNYHQLLSSIDNLKRQASNFVGLRNQYVLFNNQ